MKHCVTLKENNSLLDFLVQMRLHQPVLHLSYPIIIITMFHYNDRYRTVGLERDARPGSFTVWTWISLSSIQVRAVDKGEEVKWIQQGGAVGRDLVCNIAAAIDTSIPWLKWNQPTPRVARHSSAYSPKVRGYTYARLCASHSVPFYSVCVSVRVHAVHRETIERTLEREVRLCFFPV